jgi:hypothetical protein
MAEVAIASDVHSQLPGQRDLQRGNLVQTFEAISSVQNRATEHKGVVSMNDTLADRQAIANQLAQYAYTFDAHDVEGWVGLFMDDGVFEVRLGPSDQPIFHAQGAEQLRAFASSAPQVLHHISSLVFDELLADSARTRAMVIGTWVTPEDGNPAIQTHGTYKQRWVKVDGTWRLAHNLFLSYGYHRATFQTPSPAT